MFSQTHDRVLWVDRSVVYLCVVVVNCKMAYLEQLHTDDGKHEL